MKTLAVITIRKQRGAVLAMGLMLLTVLTIVGITSISRTSLQEQLSGNEFNKAVAFQSGESAIIDAENWLAAQSQLPTTVTTCGNPPCDVWYADAIGQLYGGTYGDNWWTPTNSTINNAWWLTQGRAFGTGNQGETLAFTEGQPRHVTEHMGFIPDGLGFQAKVQGTGVHYYRITARGNGRSVSGAGAADSPTLVIIQSIYAKSFN